MSPSPASSPAGEPLRRAALDELIQQARRLRGEVEAVGGAVTDGDGAPRGRWQRALCELAVAELDEVGARLRELRSGAAEGSGPEGSPAGSAQWNLLTDEVVWSAELFAIFGRSAERGALSLDELPSWVLDEDQPLLTAALTDTLVDGSPLDVEFRIVRPDGGIRVLHMAGEPELDAEGDTACLWAVLRDVSARRLGEQAVRDSRESLAGEGAGAPPLPDPAAEVPEAVLPRHSGGGRTDGPVRQGLQTASHYFAAEHSNLVGGAWFDALELPGGATMLTVGELTGSGVAAVSGMAMLLGAVRGMAFAGIDPGPLTGHLAELLAATGQPALKSAVCARYDAASGLLTWAQAGSCAPVLFRCGAAGELPATAGSAAAVEHSGPYPQHSARLEPGDVLVLHTEALTEPARGDGVPAGRLAGLGPRMDAASTARECLQAVVHVCAGPRDQDAGVLVARVTG
jgi:PAS domain-containing protein